MPTMAAMTEPSLAHSAIGALWVAWLLYWVSAARGLAPLRSDTRSGVLDPALFVGSMILLLAPRVLPTELTVRIVDDGAGLAAAACLMVGLGLGFAAWARRCLGRSWSSNTRLRQDHALVLTGPYRLARHPIYGGLLIAVIGTAVAIGAWRGVLAVGLMLIAMLRRSRIEERRLRATYPDYDAYRCTVARFIPFVW